MGKIYVDQVDTPIGPLTMLVTGEKLCRLDFGDWEKLGDFHKKWKEKYYPNHVFEKADLVAFKEPIHEYFAGKRKHFEFELELNGTVFQRKVWQALMQIPYGKTCSYKDIALAIDSPKAVRAVGGANNKNPLLILIPCHRVVGTNGKLVGYAGGLDKKEYLLALETEQ